MRVTGFLRRGTSQVMVQTVPIHVRDCLCYRSLEPSNNEKLVVHGEKPAEVAVSPCAGVTDHQAAIKSL